MKDVLAKVAAENILPTQVIGVDLDHVREEGVGEMATTTEITGETKEIMDQIHIIGVTQEAGTSIEGEQGRVLVVAIKGLSTITTAGTRMTLCSQECFLYHNGRVNLNFGTFHRQDLRIGRRKKRKSRDYLLWLPI